MAESLTNRFIELDNKNMEMTYETQFDSSEYHPEHFGVGSVTGKVFEEIYDQQDEWEIFFTTMFFIGIFLIPLQLIFADDIKPYDAYIIQNIQTYFIYTDFFMSYGMLVMKYVLAWVANVKFFLSMTVFFYLCFDPGVAFKTCLIAGCGSYIVFILKLITHDSRPFWVSSQIIPGLCKLSFGSPSLDVFVGMLYSHYIFFCTDRALRSSDEIIFMNRDYVEVSKYVSILLMILNACVGIFYFCMGENFIYQILITFFYGFILIRVLVIFNKDIDHFANGSRFIKEISNVSTIMTMFFVLSLSILSCILYEIVGQDLLIPREWSDNISTHCSNSNESTEISIKLTFLDSTVIFHILGAAFGVNLVLKYIDNPYYWFITSWSKRLVRGSIGFILNTLLVNMTKFIKFKSTASDYIIDSFLYAAAGFILYGFLPLFYSQIGLTNQDYLIRKKEKEQAALERKNRRATDKSLYNLHAKGASNVGSVRDVNHMNNFPDTFSEKISGRDKYKEKYNVNYTEKYKPPSGRVNSNYGYNHGYDRDYNKDYINHGTSYKISEEDDRLSRVSK